MALAGGILQIQRTVQPKLQAFSAFLGIQIPIAPSRLLYLLAKDRSGSWLQQLLTARLFHGLTDGTVALCLPLHLQPKHL
ncbi:hypothetical protein I7I50_10536 [Histoplasma capsulatum G186AR]|uniref:Uncharacterized protein n=1 Tax=Ajellomyces capsulatus TaxID=5037 RepID=A0A8H7Z7Q5_AJECA|nr:hypothetical protein I7I52_01775 [Histoplasma capsulatum]QSS69294.1 hypothetical protein I7I50_10536 [Histoplasma capsulatum G186AR]